MLKLVINLERSFERLSHMQVQFVALGIGGGWHRVAAIDGRKLSLNQIKRSASNIRDISKIICPRALSVEEIGAFLSHRKCWKQLVNSNETWALIMEDDIVFSHRAKEYLLDSSWIPLGVDIVQLFIFTKTWEAKVDKNGFKLRNGDRLFHPYYPPPVGAQAYCISRRAAKEALKLSKKIMAPVDEFLFNPISDFASYFPVYRLNPAIAMPLDNKFPSTIGVVRDKYPHSNLVRFHPLRIMKTLQFRLNTIGRTRSETFIFL